MRKPFHLKPNSGDTPYRRAAAVNAPWMFHIYRGIWIWIDSIPNGLTAHCRGFWIWPLQWSSSWTFAEWNTPTFANAEPGCQATASRDRAEASSRTHVRCFHVFACPIHGYISQWRFISSEWLFCLALMYFHFLRFLEYFPKTMMF